MFARMRFVSAFLAASAVIFHAGCQTTGGPQVNGGDPQQVPAATKDRSTGETPIDLPPAKIEARTYLAAARLHESQKRPIPALEQYQHALAEDPRNVHIMVRMGFLYDTLGNSEMAQKVYLEALRCEPNNAQLHNNLGFSYILRQRWQEAESALVRAIELAPEFARARVNLGMVLGQRGQFDDALRQFQMVLPPEEAYYNLGLMYQSKRKVVEAAEAYKRALDANPKLIAAQEQLNRMPADVLGAADRKIQEAAEAAASLAALSPEPAFEPMAADPMTDGPMDGSMTDEPVAATRPAGQLDDLLTTTFAPSAWFDDYLDGMLAEVEEWIPGATTAITEFVAVAVEARGPTTQPAEASSDSSDSELDREPLVLPVALTGFVSELPSETPTQVNIPLAPQVLSLDAMLASELDMLLPPWQRSPELIWDLGDPSTSMLGAETGEWLDLEGSSSDQTVEDTEVTRAGQTTAQTTQPE
jgi:Tfp pilus assembly protein PilF